VEATQTVDIIDFVMLSEINPMFFYKPYYIKPAKGGGKAYALLRETLRHESKVAIAKVVIKTRQYLAAVKTQDQALLLELMHFADELVEPSALDFPKFPELSKNELSMAKMLVGQMTAKWDPHKYKDEYKSALLNVIEQKIESGGHDLEAPKKTAKRASNVVDLADVLRRSLQETASRKAKRPRSAGRKVA
jgi:DNA end-binding protein Ku